MAFTNGTFLSGTDLLSQVGTFLSQNGWANYDPVSSTDRVFLSSGTLGKMPMYMRLTLNSSPNNPYNFSINSPHRVIPAMMIRGYHAWNTASHSGTNEYGIAGPLIFGSIVTASLPPSDVGNIGFVWRLDRQSGSALTENPNNYRWEGFDFNQSFKIAGDASIMDFTGDRYAIFASGTSLGRLSVADIVGNDITTSSANFGNMNFQLSQGATVYDPINDRQSYYVQTNANSTPQESFIRYDIDTDMFWRLQQTPFNLSLNGTGGTSIWDGGDLIYHMVGLATSSFFKYSISNSSWTQLSGSPVNRSFNGSNIGGTGVNQLKNTVYLTSSLTGLSSDVIYTIQGDSTPIIYSYNIKTGNWNDAGTPNIAAPLTGSSPFDSILLFDQIRYLYFFKKASSNFIWRMDAKNIAGGWSTSGSFDYNALSTQINPIILNFPVGKVRYQDGSINKYWIFGNADSISIVTRIPTSSPHYYWAHFGRPNIRRKSAIMTAVSSTSSGSAVSFTVDSTLNYSAGDSVYIVDPSNVLRQESTRILAVNDSTHLQMSVSNQYSSGSFIGVDPFQSCVSGDSGLVCAAADPKGFKYDMEPALYFLQPILSDRAISPSILSQDAIGYYQPVETVAFTGRDNVNYPRAKKGIYGSLKNTYFLPQSVSGPFSEDIITIAGKTYYYFIPTVSSRNTRFPIGYLLGPTT